MPKCKRPHIRAIELSIQRQNLATNGFSVQENTTTRESEMLDTGKIKSGNSEVRVISSFVYESLATEHFPPPSMNAGIDHKMDADRDRVTSIYKLRRTATTERRAWTLLVPTSAESLPELTVLFPFKMIKEAANIAHEQLQKTEEEYAVEN
ncbi:hypothetical protein V5O48_016422 [Marasmius crinis-equi]|uniref:Uncharacterized protein n=1 Tax=Marasmius crinis-equi TaxID=585013 RepID=A0ABR3ERU0_9AGAR